MWLRLKSPASRLSTQPFIQGADQRMHQRSASLAFVKGIHRWPVNSPHKRPVTRKMFPFDDVIMWSHLMCHGIWGDLVGHFDFVVSTLRCIEHYQHSDDQLHIEDLAQDCSISVANALEILQSYIGILLMDQTGTWWVTIMCTYADVACFISKPCSCSYNVCKHFIYTTIRELSWRQLFRQRWHWRLS